MAWLSAAMLLAAVGTGCSDSGGNNSSPASSSPATSPPATSPPAYGGSATPSASRSASAAAATVSLADSKLGSILVAAGGRTLYLFEADKSSQSTCSGGCAAAWPPLVTVGAPKAGQGVKQDLLGTTTRSDGTTEVTYNGHPLYFYAGDSNAGDTNGQQLDQFGAEWYVLNASGNKVEGG